MGKGALLEKRRLILLSPIPQDVAFNPLQLILPPPLNTISHKQKEKSDIWSSRALSDGELIKECWKTKGELWLFV